MIPEAALRKIYEFAESKGRIVFSNRDVGAISAIAGALSTMGYTSQDIVTAAILAETMPSIETVDVTATFGANVGTLHKELHDAVMKVMQYGFRIEDPPVDNTWITVLVERATNPDIRAGAQAILAARVATCREKDVEVLRADLNLLSQHYNRVPSIVPQLVSDLAARTFPPVTTHPPFWLLSISIDVVGSTEGKSKIVKLAVDQEHRHRIYERFVDAFLKHEVDFYHNIFHDYGYGQQCDGLDWHKFFVVKGIGDEIWSLY
jgi:hypothetical protein